MSKPLSGKASYKKRTLARLACVQALFQIEQTETSASSVVLEFLSRRLKDKESSLSKADTTFFAKLVEGAWKDRERNDEMIRGTLKQGWSLERIEPVTRAILRASLFELFETQTPTPVIIDEYLNLTHDFFDDTEVAFVNGVLNTLAKTIRVTD